MEEMAIRIHQNMIFKTINDTICNHVDEFVIGYGNQQTLKNDFPVPKVV